MGYAETRHTKGQMVLEISTKSKSKQKLMFGFNRIGLLLFNQTQKSTNLVNNIFILSRKLIIDEIHESTLNTFLLRKLKNNLQKYTITT